MEIKTRSGSIYNANDLVHSQIRKQIKLAALQVERKALCRPTDTHRQTGFSSGSWLWGGLQTSVTIARVWFSTCNWREKILKAMEMHSITIWQNASAKCLSECLSVQKTNTLGKWFKVTRTAFISTSTTWMLKEWLFYLTECFILQWEDGHSKNGSQEES